MENGFSALKGTDIAKDVLHHLAGPVRILAYPLGIVGIGADGHDLAAQLLKPAEELLSGEKITAPVHAAGVDFHALSLLHQDLQDLIYDLPVIF